MWPTFVFQVPTCYVMFHIKTHTMISFHSNQCNENKSVILYKIVWPLHKQLQSELTFTNGDRKHEEDVIDVKFALGKRIFILSEMLNLHREYRVLILVFTHTPMCVSTVYSVLLRVLWKKKSQKYHGHVIFFHRTQKVLSI